MENVTFFIDAEYLLQSLRSLAEKPIDVSIRKEDFNWCNFVTAILHGRQAQHIYYYTARLDETENKTTYDAQTLFLEQIQQALSAYNVELRLGKMIKIKNKMQKTWNEQRRNQNQRVSWGQKGIDTKIILDLCRYA